MSKIKIIPVVPSFAAWQRAADRLLTLETVLARNRRTAHDPASPRPRELENSAAIARVVADELFRIAYAEVNLTRGKRQAPVALAS